MILHSGWKVLDEQKQMKKYSRYIVLNRAVETQDESKMNILLCSIICTGHGHYLLGFYHCQSTQSNNSSVTVSKVKYWILHAILYLSQRILCKYDKKQPEALQTRSPMSDEPDWSETNLTIHKHLIILAQINIVLGWSVSCLVVWARYVMTIGGTNC